MKTFLLILMTLFFIASSLVLFIVHGELTGVAQATAIISMILSTGLGTTSLVATIAQLTEKKLWH